jgi:hypothetical protein
MKVRTLAKVLIRAVGVIAAARVLVKAPAVFAHGEHGVIASLRGDFVEDKAVGVSFAGLTKGVIQPRSILSLLTILYATQSTKLAYYNQRMRIGASLNKHGVHPDVSTTLNTHCKHAEAAAGTPVFHDRTIGGAEDVAARCFRCLHVA